MTPLERKIYELEQLILSVKEGVVNEAETQKTTIEALSEQIKKQDAMLEMNIKAQANTFDYLIESIKSLTRQVDLNQAPLISDHEPRFHQQTESQDQGDYADDVNANYEPQITLNETNNGL